MRAARFVISSIALVAMIAVVCVAGGSSPFHIGAADTYSHQTSENVTIGAKPLKTHEDVANAFGKRADLLRYGVLPVLVVIENKRVKTIDLRGLEVNLVGADGRHVSAVSPDDLPFLYKRKQTQIPVPVPLPKRGNPLSSPEIASRAFSAKILAPGDSASGFFYFEATAESEDRLYLSGLREMPSGAEIMYFEFGLE